MGLDLRAQVQKTPALRVQVPKVLASKINSTWRAPESCYSTPSSSDNLCLFFCLYPSSKYCSPEPLLEIVTSISVRRSLATCMDPVQNMTEPPHAVLDGTVSHKTRNLCFVRKKHELAQQVSRKFKFLIEIRKIWGRWRSHRLCGHRVPLVTDYMDMIMTKRTVNFDSLLLSLKEHSGHNGFGCTFYHSTHSWA